MSSPLRHQNGENALKKYSEEELEEASKKGESLKASFEYIVPTGNAERIDELIGREFSDQEVGKRRRLRESIYNQIVNPSRDSLSEEWIRNFISENPQDQDLLISALLRVFPLNSEWSQNRLEKTVQLLEGKTAWLHLLDAFFSFDTKKLRPKEERLFKNLLASALEKLVATENPGAFHPNELRSIHQKTNNLDLEHSKLFHALDKYIDWSKYIFVNQAYEGQDLLDFYYFHNEVHLGAQKRKQLFEEIFAHPLANRDAQMLSHLSDSEVFQNFSKAEQDSLLKQLENTGETGVNLVEQRRIRQKISALAWENGTSLFDLSPTTWDENTRQHFLITLHEEAKKGAPSDELRQFLFELTLNPNLDSWSSGEINKLLQTIDKIDSNTNVEESLWGKEFALALLNNDKMGHGNLQYLLKLLENKTDRLSDEKIQRILDTTLFALPKNDKKEKKYKKVQRHDNNGRAYEAWENSQLTANALGSLFHLLTQTRKKPENLPELAGTLFRHHNFSREIAGASMLESIVSSQYKAKNMWPSSFIWLMQSSLGSGFNDNASKQFAHLLHAHPSYPWEEVFQQFKTYGLNIFSNGATFKLTDQEKLKLLVGFSNIKNKLGIKAELKDIVTTNIVKIIGQLPEHEKDSPEKVAYWYNLLFQFVKLRDSLISDLNSDDSKPEDKSELKKGLELYFTGTANLENYREHQQNWQLFIEGLENGLFKTSDVEKQLIELSNLKLRDVESGEEQISLYKNISKDLWNYIESRPHTITLADDIALNYYKKLNALEFSSELPIMGFQKPRSNNTNFFIQRFLATKSFDPHFFNDRENWDVISQENIRGLVKFSLADRRNHSPEVFNSVFGSASRYGYTKVVKLLLTDKRIDPSANNNFALTHAARKGHTEVVKLLLSDPRVKKTLGKMSIVN